MESTTGTRALWYSLTRFASTFPIMHEDAGKPTPLVAVVSEDDLPLLIRLEPRTSPPQVPIITRVWHRLRRRCAGGGQRKKNPIGMAVCQRCGSTDA
jgi:hypothetical protein